MKFSLLLACLISFTVCERTKPNIVFILTDDQDVLLDSMAYMRNVKRLLGNRGISFKNSFVNTPICCPSRSTILTGKYVHNLGVYNNSYEGGCSSREWQANHEQSTMASILKNKAGYVTFYAGKYLNQYGNRKCGGTRHVPIGYDWWIGLKGNSKYYDYILSINGTEEKYTNRYLTDLMKDYTLEFLNQKRLEEVPFFITLATPAAHAPFTPAPRHKDAYPSVNATRTPSFNHSSLDKHWLIRMPPKYLPEDVTILDTIQRHRVQTLLAVDELVETVVDKLMEMHVLYDTFIIFASDNGFHIGQFVQPWDKRQPYETDIKVPFVVTGPKVKINLTVDFPISAVDWAPTVLDMAGIHDEGLDGRSFLKILLADSQDADVVIELKNILIEYYGEGGGQKQIECPWSYDENLAECDESAWCKCQDARNNTYSCVRRFGATSNLKYCKFNDAEDFIEVYDLNMDPFELKNIFYNTSLEQAREYEEILKKLRQCKGSSCWI